MEIYDVHPITANVLLLQGNHFNAERWMATSYLPNSKTIFPTAQQNFYGK